MLKFLDALLGRLAVSLVRPPRKVAITNYKSILIIRPGGIGDAVHLASVMALFREYFPNTAVDVLAEKRNHAVFNLYENVRTVFCYDNPTELWRALQVCYDVVIDTEQWHRLSAVVARAVSAPVSIGFASNERRRVFTHAIPYRHDEYESDSFIKLLEPLGITNSLHVGDLIRFPPGVAEKVEAFFEGYESADFVVIAPGASIAARQWGTERYRELAALLAQKGRVIAVVGGMADTRAAEEIVQGCAGISLAGKTSLEETAAIISRCSLFISGDSGILHLAVGLGVPTVSLFGPGIQEKWGPRGDNHIVINKNLPCSPCTKFGYTPKCPHDARCMQEITVEEVEAAVVTLLERTKGRSRELENVPLEKKV